MAKEYRFECGCGHKSNLRDVTATASIRFVDTPKGKRQMVVEEMWDEEYFCRKCQRDLYRE